jgi:hypothetical protein
MNINELRVESEKLMVQILFRKFLTKNKEGVFYV